MLTPTRIVVTGHDELGRSVIVEDRAAPPRENPDWPGRAVNVLWTSLVPADNAGPAPTELKVLPGLHGASLMVSHFPPDSELDAMPPAQRARVQGPVSNGDPQFRTVEATRDPRMHATETLDYVIVLQGEVTMIMEQGETVLRPFDVVIQRGAAHAWANRGAVPATLVAITLGAQPLAGG